MDLKLVDKCGLPSVLEGIKFFLKWPIALFIATKIVCSIFNIGLEPAFEGLLISVDGSTILAAYLAIPLSLELIVLSLISNHGYKEGKKAEAGLAAEIEFLKDELVKVENLQAEPNLEMIKESEQSFEDYKNRLIERQQVINTLGTLREQVILNYKRGTLDKYLRKIGLIPSSIEESKEYIAKKFILEKKIDLTDLEKAGL
ncbi:MAG TPA: hypothetical protein DCY94_00945 [Firmicutes bacterium]|nr:hypothetical protein [Bacillota bacterium]